MKNKTFMGWGWMLISASLSVGEPVRIEPSVPHCNILSRLAPGASPTETNVVPNEANSGSPTLVANEYVFTHPKSPERKFRMVVKPTKDNPDIFYSFVETIPSSLEEAPQVISLVTNLKQTSSGNFEVGWVVAIDHQKVFDGMNRVKEQFPNQSLIQSLKMLQYSSNQEIALQSSLIVEQMETAIGHKAKMPDISERERKNLARFGKTPQPEISDADFTAFFQNLRAQKAPQGTTFAVVEQLIKTIPVGGKIEFDVANKETVSALGKDIPWSETPLGRYASKAGMELVTLSPPVEKGFRKATLVKRTEKPDFFHWK